MEQAMNHESALNPVEQKEIDFYGDELIAVRAEDGHIYVSLRHLCEALGIDTQGQARRIKRQPVLTKGYSWVDILSTQPTPQRRRSQVLRVDLVPLFLTGISTRNISDSANRIKLERFQEEAAKVLWEAFQSGQLTPDPAFDDLLQADTPAAQAYRMARALVEMARQQLILEARLGDHAAQLAAHDDRLEQIEATLGDRGRFITPEQASSISQAVKSIALTLGKQSGRNEYGAVYGEFYRKFGIPSYRELPARRFDEAVRFLTDWYQRLTGEGLPF